MVELNHLRLQGIAAEVLQILIPGCEALDSVRGLQKKLRGLCADEDPVKFTQKLMEFLPPKVDTLVQRSFISKDEAGAFVADVVSQLLAAEIYTHEVRERHKL